MTENREHARHKPTSVPYTTSTGIKIGHAYTPPARVQFSRDEELLQDMLLRSPYADGMDDLGRLALFALVLLISALGALCWAFL